MRCSSRRLFISATVAAVTLAGVLPNLSVDLSVSRSRGSVNLSVSRSRGRHRGGLGLPPRVPLGRAVDDRFSPMKRNNYSDTLCSAEKYSSDQHVVKMGALFTFLESYEYPYWHDRGLARIASRFGAGLIEVKPGLKIVPDHDFDLMMLVRNESHWTTTIRHMEDHCPENLFCTVKKQWNIPRLYIWQVGEPVKYANLMPTYRRNATHAQYHPFHKEKFGMWSRLEDIFPLKKAKLWMYELPVARESWEDCEDGLNVTRIYATHQLETTEEQRMARRLMYSCAQNLTAKGFASYFHCFDEHGIYNGSSWKA